MTVSNIDLIKAFWQQGANNCASIALIKAAIETFGLYNVFSLTLNDNLYTANLQNGDTVIFTYQNLQDSNFHGSFQSSRDTNPAKQELYKEIKEYAQLCFAVMVAQYNIKNNLNSFNIALEQLSNGANARSVSRYLGLENHASESFRGGSQNRNMFAWQHSPFLKHVVYMSQDSYDYYGEEFNNTSKFPKRIQLSAQKPQHFEKTYTTFNELNYINISRFGTFKETGQIHSTPQDVDNIIEHLKENNINNLLLHFHGGLVDENRGMASAKTFYDSFKDQNNAHTVSIIWETGIFDALPQALLNILRSDSFLQNLIIKASGFLGKLVNITSNLDESLYAKSFEDYASFIQSNTLEINEEDLQKIFTEHEAEMPLGNSTEQSIYNELNQQYEDEQVNQYDLERIQKDSNKEAFINVTLLWVVAKIVKRCIVRFVNKRGHGLWCTVLEEACREIFLDDLGTETWKKMKNQATNMWIENNGRTGLDQFAGRYLMDKLVAAFPDNTLNIHVVAHSAGSIAVCEWVNAIKSSSKYNAFKFKNLFYLAPACTCDLFKNTIMQYPETYQNFMMFTMDDMYERTDNLIPIPVLGIIYPRSLLYLISGILEGRDPKDADAYILGLHRHIKKMYPYSNESLLNQVSDFLILNNRLILSKTDSSANNGRRSTATQHGGFAKDLKVIESIKYLIA